MTPADRGPDGEGLPTRAIDLQPQHRRTLKQPFTRVGHQVPKMPTSNSAPP